MLKALEVKKLVSVLATSMSVTNTRKKVLVLKRVLCIHYPVQFRKDANKTQIQALIKSESEVNTIHLIFVKEQGFSIRSIEMKTQKIDGTILDTYGMVVAAFLMMDKANRVKFFKEIFMVANVSLEVAFKMPFFILSGANVDFLSRELQ